MARSLISAMRSSYNHSTESMKRNIRIGVLSGLLMSASAFLLSATSRVSGEDLARKYAGLGGLVAGLYGSAYAMINGRREEETYYTSGAQK